MKHDTLSNIALACCLFAGMSGYAEAGEGPVADQIAGTWSLVSLVVHRGEERISVFGDEPRGIQIMHPNGRFAVITTRAELPLYASNNRMQGTDEEYRAIGKGSNAAYGTYTIDEADQSITFNVEVSTFPNWEGQQQRRVFTIEGDDWRYVNPSPAIGEGNVHVHWRRLR